MTARRLRAPATDGGLLAEPPLVMAAHEAVSNAARLSAWEYDFQGRPASWLRSQTRREIVELAHAFLGRHGFDVSTDGPGSPSGADPILIVTGHQPELFHPGVWVKNFAASALGRSCGGLALNLIVDNDIPKSASIRVPRVQGGRIGAVAVDFDRWQGEIPYEDWKVLDESTFATFGDRAREALAGAVADPLLDDYWPRVLRRRGEAETVGLRFALARREVEESWGVSNLELPLGTLCQSEGFLWFASHLIAQLPRYQQVHNTCLAEYRAAHHIRSRHHPVAALARADDWLEAPFWVCALVSHAVGRFCAPASAGRRAAHRWRVRGPDRTAAHPGRRGLLRRRAAPRLARTIGPAAHPSPDHHHVRPVLARRPVHPRDRRRQV